MSKYYLRTEGVNFDSFVLDTDRNKIVRGGGLMLLNSVHWLEEHSQGLNWRKLGLPPLRVVTSGASWGLFSFDAEDDHQAGMVLGAARKAFNDDEFYRHATIVLAVHPAGEEDKYPDTRARLESLCRWQQMQNPSVAIPSVDGEFVKGVCEFDAVRPAVDKADLIREENGKKRADISAACRVRWVLDGKEREPRGEYLGFYEKRTKLRESYVRDLHELAEDPGFSNLNGKMAVIYLDGNRFGKMARDFCKTESLQHQFDDILRVRFQNGALEHLLKKIRKDAAWKNGNRIRLETLLWGGDEIIWVVPAWKGWWMMGEFFHISKSWKIDGKQLTHGAGLVFCHHNAPIQPIISLVRSLGEIAKGTRKKNRLAYQILESFDHAGLDLESVRRKRWPLEDMESQVLNGDTMLEADRVIRKIKMSDLPKRKLYQIANTAFKNEEDALEIAQEMKERIEIENTDWKEVEACFGPGLSAWLHLLELWDYIGLNGEERVS